MQAPWAFMNGRMIPAAELAIPAYDAGFVLGATVSEQLRTFGGKLYKLDEHLARLRRGLEITEINAGCTSEQLGGWANELVAQNHKLLDPADDLGLSLFITPGPYATLAPPDVPRRATIGMSTYPLPFHLWADKYEAGEHLRITTVHQVSVDSWPAELKCRSRMHYFLAEKEVRRKGGGARPLLLDDEGYLNETPTANIVWYRDSRRQTGSDHAGEVLFSLPEHKALNGVSQHALIELGKSKFQLGNVPTQIRPSEVGNYSEFLLTSTPFCVLPVVKLDDAPIGDGRPGPMYRKLLAAWSEEVGVDIAEQARRFAKRA